MDDSLRVRRDVRPDFDARAETDFWWAGSAGMSLLVLWWECGFLPGDNWGSGAVFWVALTVAALVRAFKGEREYDAG